jgi:N-glycosylase/DNA lyase
MATMGNSRGYKGLIENSDNYREVAYENLLNQKNVERYKMILETLKKAKIRMAAQKAKWLYENFVMIESMGGAEKAREMALNEHGMEKKIAFMMHFKGIGPKYARNVWMDFYHPDFYQNIAIDERIKKISKILNVELENYTEHENFYLEIAKESGLQGWELDRILYSYNDEFVASLQNEE